MKTTGHFGEELKKNAAKPFKYCNIIFFQPQELLLYQID